MTTKKENITIKISKELKKAIKSGKIITIRTNGKSPKLGMSSHSLRLGKITNEETEKWKKKKKQEKP